MTSQRSSNEIAVFTSVELLANSMRRHFEIRFDPANLATLGNAGGYGGRLLLAKVAGTKSQEKS
jgi:hypothetical protein